MSLCITIQQPLRAPVDEGKCLRFYVTSEEDFQQFKQCIVDELAQTEFISADSLEDIPQQD